MLERPLKIVFLDRETISARTDLRRLSFPHELTLYGRTAKSLVADRIAQADIVITNKAAIDEAALAGAPHLRLIAVAATGTDVVDVKACHARGITVSNVRGYATRTVPEHAFALIFALRRSITAYRDSVKAGRWYESQQFCYFDYPIKDLAGSTLGVIGDGVLGQAVASIGRALNMHVIFAGRKGAGKAGALYTPFEKMLGSSDIISLHCPLNAQTRNMIDEAEFAQMARKPLLINTARGGLVNEAALGRALRSGQISGAGFDVTSPEPPGAQHPLMQLLDLPNFILTPHVAWASEEAIQSLANQLMDNIEAFHQGVPNNVV